MPFDPVSIDFWERKYRFKTPDGPVDNSVEDTWSRIALSLASVENDPDAWAPKFYEALEGFKFIPAGRVVANAGTGRDTTMFNCFVMGTIDDSMAGIFECLKQSALTLRQGGGIGVDFSPIRPAGSLVRGIGARAMGPVAFMECWQSMARTMKDAGDRVAAMMGTMRCDHPDIEAFITAKRTPGRLSEFNLSVLVTDRFMEAIDGDLPWELTFGGEVYRTVRARDLWDLIMRSTYAYAEPGVIFIDRVNRDNNLWYCEDIQATNPCFSGATRILTTRGYRTARDLWEAGGRQEYDGTPSIDRHGELRIVNDRGEAAATNVYRTARKAPLYRVSFRDGRYLDVTATHGWYRPSGERVATADLRPGDEIPAWGGSGVFGTYHAPDYALLAGWVIGDGSLAAWPAYRGAVRAVARCWNDDIEAVMPHLREAMGRLYSGFAETPHATERSDEARETTPRGFEHREASIKSLVLGRMMAADGVVPGDKHRVPASIWGADEETAAAFLRALFSADGSVQVNKARSCISIRLAQNSDRLLRECQLLLSQFGICSSILLRRVASTQMMNDGRGGKKEYVRAPQYELIVSGRSNVETFSSRIEFIQDAKNDKARGWLVSHPGSNNSRSAVRTSARVVNIEYIGEDETFCLTEPQSSRVLAEGITTSNCGEVPLPPYAACLLGSVCLPSFVRRAFTSAARLDLRELRRIVRLAVRMLDNVNDVSNFPLRQQREQALTKRRLGLGVTGLADALAMCGLRYGSPEAVLAAEKWASAIEEEAYLASADLAAEKGCFPAYDAARFSAGDRYKTLPGRVRRAVQKHGLRNSHLTAVAPTGTISLLAGNVSGGIEPIFRVTYGKRVRQPDGSYVEERMDDYAYREWERLGCPGSPHWVTSGDLTWEEHLETMAAWQRHTDQSISKTINLRRDISFDEFQGVYRRAYALGCKSCTTYRPNDVVGSVLVADDDRATPVATEIRPMESLDDDGNLSGFRTRPLELSGTTYKLRWGGDSMYLVMNDEVKPDGRRVPMEMLLVSQNVDSQPWISALTRMITAVMRRDANFSFIPAELMRVYSARGGEFQGGRYIPSELALIGRQIREHFIRVGYMEVPDAPSETAAQAASPVGSVGYGQIGSICPSPDCGQPSVIRIEGCDKCQSCGWSSCG